MTKLNKTMATVAIASSVAMFGQMASAATFEYSGSLTGGDGAIIGLAGGLGTAFSSSLTLDDDGAYVGSVNVIGAFCFADGTCPAGTQLVPIESVVTDAAVLDADGNPVSGSITIEAFSPTFNLLAPVTFEFNDGGATVIADATGGGLGTAIVTATLDNPIAPPPPIPVPAAAWLFGSALLGLAGVRRRK